MYGSIIKPRKYRSDIEQKVERMKNIVKEKLETLSTPKHSAMKAYDITNEPFAENQNELKIPDRFYRRQSNPTSDDSFLKDLKK